MAIKLSSEMYTLIGVLIGGGIGLLAPLVQNWINNRSRRNKVKYDLIEIISLYYNTRTLAIKYVNDRKYYSKKRKLAIEASNSNSFAPHEITMFKLRAESDFTLMTNINNDVVPLHKTLVKYQAAIIKLKFKVKDFYSSKVFDKIDSVVQIITKGTKELEAIESFETIKTYEALMAITVEFKRRVKEKQIQVEEESENVIRQILEILQ